MLVFHSQPTVVYKIYISYTYMVLSLHQPLEHDEK